MRCAGGAPALEPLRRVNTASAKFALSDKPILPATNPNLEGTGSNSKQKTKRVAVTTLAQDKKSSAKFTPEQAVSLSKCSYAAVSLRNEIKHQTYVVGVARVRSDSSQRFAK